MNNNDLIKEKLLGLRSSFLSGTPEDLFRVTNRFWEKVGAGGCASNALEAVELDDKILTS